jgi:hypothetical protein
LDYTVSDVVRATGAPRANVEKSWPALLGALHMRSIADRLVQVGTIATVGTEVWSFIPVSERGEHPEYDTGRLAARLGNTPEADGDGQKYEGRGFIQLTGLANYTTYGEALGLDLVNNPDLALQPDTAAAILALYFRKRGVDAACMRCDWRAVRKLVNGGYNHWDRFAKIVNALGEQAV